MSGLVIVLALLAAALCVLYVVTGIELDRRTTERDNERAKRETAEAVLYAVRRVITGYQTGTLDREAATWALTHAGLTAEMVLGGEQ